MSAIHFGKLLNELSGVMSDEGFNITPDQIVRANAVLLRLGVDRSPSGLVNLLSPIFCTTAEEQELFPGLFVQALDQSDPTKARLTIGDGRLLVRAPDSDDEEDAEETRQPQGLLARFGRPVGAILLAVAFVAIVFVQLSKQPEEPPPGSIPEPPSRALQIKRDGVPKSLPRIEGRSRLDIQIDSSGRDEIPVSMMAKSPLASSSLLGLILAAVVLLALLLRRKWNGAPKPNGGTIVAPVPQMVPYSLRPEKVVLANGYGMGTKVDIVASIQEHARLGYWKELARKRPSHQEYFAQSRPLQGDPEMQTVAIESRRKAPGSNGTARYSVVHAIVPFWTRRRVGQYAAATGIFFIASSGVIPFLPILSVKNNIHHVASKPLGVDFGDWICFTKIEQVIKWRLPDGTTIQKMEIEGYDQTSVGEGFQLISRSDPHITVGPVVEVDGPMSDHASLVFEPLHAKEYAGVLKIATNHGEVKFGLRGTGVYGGDACVDEGHGQFGLESDFNGNGCNQIDMHNGHVSALLAPARPTGPSDTHSALVLGPWRQGEFELQCGIRTIAQLRDSGPNPWEVGWLIWNFSDLNHFYYLSLKANGWELGRRDPSYPGGQKFLATKNSPQFPPGQRYFVHLSRQGDTLTVDVNGVRLVSITDTDHPVASGRVGFYSECADSKFDSLEIK